MFYHGPRWHHGASTTQLGFIAVNPWYRGFIIVKPAENFKITPKNWQLSSRIHQSSQLSPATLPLSNVIWITHDKRQLKSSAQTASHFLPHIYDKISPKPQSSPVTNHKDNILYTTHLIPLTSLIHYIIYQHYHQLFFLPLRRGHTKFIPIHLQTHHNDKTHLETCWQTYLTRLTLETTPLGGEHTSPPKHPPTRVWNRQYVP